MDMNELTLDGFEAIWARVQGAEPAALPLPESDTEAVLLRLLEQEAESAVFERELACRCPGMEALYRDTCRRFQCLRALWFLRTGERFTLERRCCTLRGALLQDLRKDFLAVTERSENYAAAGEKTADPMLRETYAELAEKTSGHAGRLLSILRRVLDTGR